MQDTLVIGTKFGLSFALNQVLLDSGANTNFCNSTGMTPLHSVVTVKWFMPYVELLTQKGADLDAQNSRGESPLHMACSANNDPCVEVSVSILSFCFLSLPVSFIVILIGIWTLKQYLLQKGASINCLSLKRHTPLHYACGIGSKSIVEVNLLTTHLASFIICINAYLCYFNGFNCSFFSRKELTWMLKVRNKERL